MMSKFVERSFGNKKDILKFPDHYVALAVTVDNTGITANADGKKIVPAGTIVGGSTGAVLTNLNQKVVKKNTQGSTATAAEGVLMDDVDVTYGPAPAAMIIHGFIAQDKLPEAPAAEAATALKGRITFIK